MEQTNLTKTHSPVILLVEDNPVQAIRLKIGLEGGGCQVHWADTGLTGLERAHSYPFDLIVLDVQLPDIDGFEVCRRLKADGAVAHVPVVILTTCDGAQDALTGLANGAADYIPKDPFAEMVLLETLRQMGLLARSSGQAS
ncbi:MAG: response regulator [Chloroflexi bacterium]|nr:response regulator [Chloroflexota bacterium]MCI0575179.1 response regulator [Chloroflexota bacterium]MCI0647139.1 response regulator [Chloroflexota bacterium]MCI0729985.1 response regulator [Chloroflexota bacterium]